MVLTQSGVIRAEHLDVLWAATEAEGTFDVVKCNVFTMIEELASGLSQVGGLPARWGESRGRVSLLAGMGARCLHGRVQRPHASGAACCVCVCQLLGAPQRSGPTPDSSGCRAQQ